MNIKEARQALFLLKGHWPNPKMEEAEAAMWGGYFGDWTTAEFAAAIRKVTLVVDRAPFRPVPSEVAQLIAAQRRREQPDVPQLPNGERFCTPAENAAALDEILRKTTLCFGLDAS